MTLNSNHRVFVSTIGLTCLAIGVLLSGAVVRTFRAASTPISPRRPAATIVRSGPYKYSRNPDYLGQTLIYVGATVLAATWWPLLLLPLVLLAIQRGVIRREERYLEGRFGREYRDYAAHVRRWL